MWRLFSSLMARLTRFAKRESWSFDGCSLALPVHLTRRDRRSPVTSLSASDRVSASDRLSNLTSLLTSNFALSSVTTYLAAL
jgi:hypothetical protein